MHLKLRKPGRTRTCLCYLLWFFLANAAIFSICAFIANWSEHDSGKTFDKNFYLKQENSFRAFPILDLQSVPSSQNCPDNWQPLFKSVTTPGTSSFCVCQESQTAYSLKEFLNYHEQEIHVTPGEEDESTNQDSCSSECLRLKASFPVMLPRVNSRLLCARMLNIRYDDFELSSDGICPGETRRCGKDSRDFLCLDRNLPCPLNRVRVLPKIQDIQDQRKVNELFEGKSYKIVEFSNTENLYFSNEFPEEVVLTQEFMLSREAPCMDPTQHQMGPTEKNHLGSFWKGWNVEKCHPRSFSEFEVDHRYSQLFSFEKKTLLNDNNFFHYIMEESKNSFATDNGQSQSNSQEGAANESATSREYVRSFLEQSATGSVGVWFKGFTNFRKHCRTDNNSLKTFHGLHVRKNYDYQNVKKQVLGANTIAWVTMIYSIILLAWVFCCRNEKRTKQVQSQPKRLIFGTILFVLSTSSLIILGITVFYIYERYQRLSWLCANDCSDGLTTEVFCYGRYINWIFLICFLAMVILHLIGIFVYIYWLFGLKVRKDKKEKYSKKSTRTIMSKELSQNNLQPAKHSNSKGKPGQMHMDDFNFFNVTKTNPEIEKDVELGCLAKQDSKPVDMQMDSFNPILISDPYLTETEAPVTSQPIDAKKDGLKLIVTTGTRLDEEVKNPEKRIFKPPMKEDSLEVPSVTDTQYLNSEIGEEAREQKSVKMKNSKNNLSIKLSTKTEDHLFSKVAQGRKIKQKKITNKTRTLSHVKSIQSIANEDGFLKESLRNDYIKTEDRLGVEGESRAHRFKPMSQRSGFLPREKHVGVNQEEIKSMRSSKLAMRKSEYFKKGRRSESRSPAFSQHGFGQQVYNKKLELLTSSEISMSSRKRKFLERKRREQSKSRGRNATYSGTTFENKSQCSMNVYPLKKSIRQRELYLLESQARGAPNPRKSANGSHIELESYLTISGDRSQRRVAKEKPRSVTTIDDIQVIKLSQPSHQYIDTSLDRDQHMKNPSRPVMIYQAKEMVAQKKRMESKRGPRSVSGQNKTYAKSITRSSLEMNVFNHSNVQRASSQPVKKYQLSPYKSKNIAKKKGAIQESIMRLKEDFSFKKPVKARSSRKKHKNK